MFLHRALVALEVVMGSVGIDTGESIRFRHGQAKRWRLCAMQEIVPRECCRSVYCQEWMCGFTKRLVSGGYICREGASVS